MALKEGRHVTSSTHQRQQISNGQVDALTLWWHSHIVLQVGEESLGALPTEVRVLRVLARDLKKALPVSRLRLVLAIGTTDTNRGSTAIPRTTVVVVLNTKGTPVVLFPGWKQRPLLHCLLVSDLQLHCVQAFHRHVQLVLMLHPTFEQFRFDEAGLRNGPITASLLIRRKATVRHGLW